MNYERVEMANGKSDGTEVPFLSHKRRSVRRVWAVHTWVDVLSLAGGSGSAGRAQERFLAWSAAGGADVMTVVTVFDLEVTAYDV